MVSYSKIKTKRGKIIYVNEEAFGYYSNRYNKTCRVREGFTSDGATGAMDICTRAWWVHDVLKATGVWDDGTVCTNHQASMVIHDILQEEGNWFRAKTWCGATFIFGELSKLFRRR